MKHKQEITSKVQREHLPEEILVKIYMHCTPGQLDTLGNWILDKIPCWLIS